MRVFAYHGTTASAAAAIDRDGFEQNRNTRPKWLGEGVYFFQDAPDHARNWANFLSGKRRGDTPVVYRAEIDLGNCLDLVDATHWSDFRAMVGMISSTTLHQLGPEALFRPRSAAEDAALGLNYEDDFYVNLFVELKARSQPVDAVRCAFVEGEPLHTRSWLLDRSHIQVCVKNPGAIKSLQKVAA